MGLRGGWGAFSVKLVIIHTAYTNYPKANKKKIKGNFDSETEEKPNNFPSFIEMESTEEIPLSKLSPFKIEKILSKNLKPKAVQKTKK